jgi:hypothetical protein
MHAEALAQRPGLPVLRWQSRSLLETYFHVMVLIIKDVALGLLEIIAHRLRLSWHLRYPFSTSRTHST